MYSLELKIKIVEMYLNGHASQGQLCKEYGLSCKKLIRNWIKKYQAGKLTAGKVAARPTTKKDGVKNWRSRKKFASKEDEFEYLKLENQYLKKKLLAQGVSETFIANLWSSKNLK